MSIRDSVERAAERSLSNASQVFEMDEITTVNAISGFERVVTRGAPIAGQILDVVTTIDGIQNRGLTEANPVMRGIVKNVPLFALVKLGVGAGMVVLVKKAQDKGQKKAARVLSAALTATGLVPGLSNLRQAGRL